jgi:hypothetical protein
MKSESLYWLKIKMTTIEQLVKLAHSVALLKKQIKCSSELFGQRSKLESEIIKLLTPLGYNPAVAPYSWVDFLQKLDKNKCTEELNVLLQPFVEQMQSIKKGFIQLKDERRKEKKLYKSDKKTLYEWIILPSWTSHMNCECKSCSQNYYDDVNSVVIYSCNFGPPSFLQFDPLFDEKNRHKLTMSSCHELGVAYPAYAAILAD